MYRKIEIKVWTDKKFRSLTPLQPSGQALWFYLLTGPQTGIIPGLFKAGHAAMAEELGWELKAFEEAFREVFREGLVKDSPEDHLVWLPNCLKYNPPSSPNVIRSWANAKDLLPDCDLLHEAIESMRDEIELLDKSGVKGFAKAFEEVFPKALPKAFAKALPKPFGESGTGTVNSNQEQEKKREEKSARANVARPARTADRTTLPAYGDGEPVYLSDEEHALLKARYNIWIVEDYIRRVSRWAPQDGKRPANDYLTILKWIEKDNVPTKEIKQECPHCWTVMIDDICRNPDCEQYKPGFKGQVNAAS